MQWMCPLQDIPAVLSHWMYCHLVMCSETCMFKRRGSRLSSNVEMDNIYLCSVITSPFFFSNQQQGHSLEVEVWEGRVHTGSR